MYTDTKLLRWCVASLGQLEPCSGQFTFYRSLANIKFKDKSIENLYAIRFDDVIKNSNLYNIDKESFHISYRMIWMTPFPTASQFKGIGSSMTHGPRVHDPSRFRVWKLKKNNLKSLPWPLTTGISYLKESIDKEWNLATLERTKIFPEEDAIELIQDRFCAYFEQFSSVLVLVKSIKSHSLFTISIY